VKPAPFPTGSSPPRKRSWKKRWLVATVVLAVIGLWAGASFLNDRRHNEELRREERARKESWNRGWREAVEESRACEWCPDEYDPGSSGGLIFAVFSDTPSGSTKVQALRCRGLGEMVKGSLSGTK
jgi:hypothetical protein